MSNFRQAPKLYHSASKGNGHFYQLPQSLMDCIFSQLTGKEGNLIKLMCVLLGTAGDGSFAVSEKYIRDRTGMNQSSYSRARKELINRGWLKLEKGRLLVDVNAIRDESPKVESSHVEDMLSEDVTCDHDMSGTCDENMHNKEKQINNNKKRNNADSVAPQRELKENGKMEIPEHVLKKLQEIGIDFKPNSLTALEEIAGEKLSFYILYDLLVRYREDFARAKGKPESYIFAILKNKVQTDYKREKNKREAQRLEDEQMSESRRQYAMAMKGVWETRTDPKEQEGLGDISDLLDEMDEDDNTYPPELLSEERIPESLRLLERLTAERLAAETADDF